ncbi:dTDP-glucose 4,6-dehydratase [Aristophania vespae]|uniref:dTDP-glucose 4,6-dehydratase n=1 Tax=Aristophania vespae TaxID=2697033 RepID=A0A6P1NFB1_9PROT|nr:dTDP-glucose 4,6-dehydratase [Aristophania vespae]QHI96249.1 dTDP-glucose 4,6-dehydratase [Aristophania vespae]UMM64053.1 dTDP-glucose 4,6-dehydratase 2 [Aristophania vespae]
MHILLTGGYGFIGSAVIRHLINKTSHTVLNVDCMTYAASAENLSSIEQSSRYQHERVDIVNVSELHRLFATYKPDAVMHLAAESHVDRSIDDPAIFIQTNIIGTYMLLEASRKYWNNLEAEKKNSFRFHHISTDEVFGHLDIEAPAFTEQSPYDPRSPYSASKASSDHLVRAWHSTYGLPAFVTNTTNNYGPWHFPEKLIPLIIIKALKGQPLPVYGKGSNIRDWLFVEDHAEALVRAIERGVPGETYAISGRQPCSNLEVVKKICAILDELKPDPAGPRERLINFVSDRPGHDFRYEINPTHAEQALEWKAAHNFDMGLRKTINWFLENENWWQNILDKRYTGQRLGTRS